MLYEVSSVLASLSSIAAALQAGEDQPQELIKLLRSITSLQDCFTEFSNDFFSPRVVWACDDLEQHLDTLRTDLEVLGDAQQNCRNKLCFIAKGQCPCAHFSVKKICDRATLAKQAADDLRSVVMLEMEIVKIRQGQQLQEATHNVAKSSREAAETLHAIQEMEIVKIRQGQQLQEATQNVAQSSRETAETLHAIHIVAQSIPEALQAIQDSNANASHRSSQATEPLSSQTTASDGKASSSALLSVPLLPTSSSARASSARVSDAQMHKAIEDLNQHSMQAERVQQRSFRALNKVKIIMVGESNAGKTTLVKRFVSGGFVPNLPSTIGVDFICKTTNQMVNGENVKLMIWDTAGMEKYSLLSRSYYHSADVVLLVYDTTSAASWERLTEFWLEEARSHAKDAVIAIVGNKSDRQPFVETGWVGDSPETFTRRLCLYHFSTSAYTGCGVDDLFNELASRVVQELIDEEAQRPRSFPLRRSPSTRTSEGLRCQC